MKHGIAISHRTVFTVYWGGVLAFWGLTFLGWRPLIGILMFGLIGLPAWYASYSQVAWFSQTTRRIAATVQQTMPAPLQTYKRVIVDARDFEGFYARQTDRPARAARPKLRALRTSIIVGLLPCLSKVPQEHCCARALKSAGTPERCAPYLKLSDARQLRGWRAAHLRRRR